MHVGPGAPCEIHWVKILQMLGCRQYVGTWNGGKRRTCIEMKGREVGEQYL